jgi:hypothetical protein
LNTDVSYTHLLHNVTVDVLPLNRSHCEYVSVSSEEGGMVILTSCRWTSFWISYVSFNHSGNAHLQQLLKIYYHGVIIVTKYEYKCKFIMSMWYCWSDIELSELWLGSWILVLTDIFNNISAISYWWQESDYILYQLLIINNLNHKKCID